MNSNPVARAIRQTKHTRSLGPNPICQHCGWSDPVALARDGDEITCYECRAATSGKRMTEQHHQLGRASDPSTIAIPGNLHRDLSDRQRDWPTAVHRNPERDPLLWLVAATLGLRDHLAWWTDWLDRIATWLGNLADMLRNEHGPRWWESMDLEPIWTGVRS